MINQLVVVFVAVLLCSQYLVIDAFSSTNLRHPSTFLNSVTKRTFSTQLQAVFEIREGNFDELVTKNPQPVLLDFYANWCGPCKMMSPIFDQLSQEIPAVKFVKVNADLHPELLEKYNVQGLPTFAVFSGGKLIAAQPGAMPKSNLQDFVTRAIKSIK